MADTTMFANGRPTAQQISEMYGGVYNATPMGLPQPLTPTSWDAFYQGILPPAPAKVAPQRPISPTPVRSAATALASMFTPSAAPIPDRLAPSHGIPANYGNGYVAPTAHDYALNTSDPAHPGKLLAVAAPVNAGGTIGMPVPRPAHTPAMADVAQPVVRPAHQPVTLASMFSPRKAATSAPSVSLTVHGGNAPVDNYFTTPAPRSISDFNGSGPRDTRSVIGYDGRTPIYAPTPVAQPQAAPVASRLVR